MVLDILREDKSWNGVSVSLRSIIHSYLMYLLPFLFLIKFPSPYGVSFILILSKNEWLIFSKYVKFPSPYGVSFILILDITTIVLSNILTSSFRLLTEYHSFLSQICFYYTCIIIKFPSPYGVSFILIKVIV